MLHFENKDEFKALFNEMLEENPTVCGLVVKVNKMDEKFTGQVNAQAITLAKMDAKLTVMDANLTTMDANLTAMDTKLTAMDTKLTAMDTKLTAMDTKLTTMDTKLTTMDARHTAMDNKFTDQILFQGILAEEMNRKFETVCEAIIETRVLMKKMSLITDDQEKLKDKTELIEIALGNHLRDKARHLPVTL